VVGDNVWLGGGVMVCPGGGIGENTVVGAGDPVIDCYDSAAKGDPQPDQGRELASPRVG
jgi:acetyltransferase-like isoleucine patch superfamily enzyme